LVLFLMYNRFSIFGGDDDSGDWVIFRRSALSVEASEKSTLRFF
jgi:hypothetical protein